MIWMMKYNDVNIEIQTHLDATGDLNSGRNIHVLF
jgi:hypothetical protein